MLSKICKVNFTSHKKNYLFKDIIHPGISNSFPFSRYELLTTFTDNGFGK